LAALPAGSLGRAYLEFTSQYRFDAETFETAHDLDGMGRRLGWDADIAYVVGRGLQLHDLWHTLAAYGPDWCGEGGVMAFTRGQIPDTGIAVITTIQRVVPCGVPRRRWTTFLEQARERGRRADNLIVAPYEDLLPVPLDEVREQLRIAPIEQAHPAGIPFVRFGYGFGKTRSREDCYEPLRLHEGEGR
jgi:ubiquinone biosynthesis protein Coq4